MSTKDTADRIDAKHTTHQTSGKYYRQSIAKTRILLMFCSILYTYMLHAALDEFNGIIFGFSFPALFIISGYVVLRESRTIEKRILRTIRRTAVCFAALIVFYGGLSLLAEPYNTVKAVTSIHFWVDFLLLNIWSLPIGTTIWFVQALLYAYIIIYVIYKLNLLQYDIYIAAVCIVITFLTGEFSSIIGFRFMGHTYLGGNFLTRALPYILIGCFIHRQKKHIASLKRKYYYGVIVFGLLLMAEEYLTLALTDNKTYVGHLLGMGVVAVGVAALGIYGQNKYIWFSPLQELSRYEMMIPYFVCSPLYYFFLRFTESLPGTVARYVLDFTGTIVAILSFAVLYGYALVIRYIKAHQFFNKKSSKSDHDGTLQ